RTPALGRVSIFTASRWLLSGSLNPKSPAASTLVACQASETVSSAPAGAWLTGAGAEVVTTVGGGGDTGAGGGETGGGGGGGGGETGGGGGDMPRSLR